MFGWPNNANVRKETRTQSRWISTWFTPARTIANAFSFALTSSQRAGARGGRAGFHAMKCSATFIQHHLLGLHEQSVARLAGEISYSVNSSVMFTFNVWSLVKRTDKRPDEEVIPVGVSSVTPTQKPLANLVVPTYDIVPDQLKGRINTLSPTVIHSGRVLSGTWFGTSGLDRFEDSAMDKVNKRNGYCKIPRRIVAVLEKRDSGKRPSLRGHSY